MPTRRGETGHGLACLYVMTKADVEGIVKSGVTKCTSTQQSKIMNSFESTFEHVLNASYFNTKNGFRANLFEVVSSGRAPAVSKTRIWSLVQTQSVAQTID